MWAYIDLSKKYLFKQFIFKEMLDKFNLYMNMYRIEL